MSAKNHGTVRVPSVDLSVEVVTNPAVPGRVLLTVKKYGISQTAGLSVAEAEALAHALRSGCISAVADQACGVVR